MKHFYAGYFTFSGGMYYPYVWSAKNTPSFKESPSKFKFLDVPIPQDHCQEESSPYGCRFKIGLAEWYTNDTKIPGEPSLSDDMYDQWSSKISRKNPWGAPGSAPVYGEGCGVNGGNPNGCGKGKKDYFDTDLGQANVQISHCANV